MSFIKPCFFFSFFNCICCLQFPLLSLRIFLCQCSQTDEFSSFFLWAMRKPKDLSFVFTCESVTKWGGAKGETFHLSSGGSSWEHLCWSVRVADFQKHYFMEMERCWICSLIWLNIFLAFQCLEAPGNLGKVSPIIISCVGSLKFTALVLYWCFCSGDGNSFRDV